MNPTDRPSAEERETGEEPSNSELADRLDRLLDGDTPLTLIEIDDVVEAVARLRASQPSEDGLREPVHPDAKEAVRTWLRETIRMAQADPDARMEDLFDRALDAAPTLVSVPSDAPGVEREDVPENVAFQYRENLAAGMDPLAAGLRSLYLNPSSATRSYEDDARILRALASSSRDGVETVFSCPHCGDPNATVKGGSLDIHAGAGYLCSGCDGPVIFEALTPDQYIERCNPLAARPAPEGGAPKPTVWKIDCPNGCGGLFDFAGTHCPTCLRTDAKWIGYAEVSMFAPPASDAPGVERGALESLAVDFDDGDGCCGWCHNKLLWGHDEGCPTQVARTALASSIIHRSEVRRALEWALDLIDMYDTRLAEIDGPELVYSETHMRGKEQARRALASAPPVEDAKPHGSEWTQPSAPPADDCPNRRAVFVWNDESGQWEMERWLDGPPVEGDAPEPSHYIVEGEWVDDREVVETYPTEREAREWIAEEIREIERDIATGDLEAEMAPGVEDFRVTPVWVGHPPAPAALREALEGIPTGALNDLLAWIDNDGDERADDAIVKLTDAVGRPLAHVSAGWLKRFITATNGTRFGDCGHCGRRYGEHTPSEEAECDRALAAQQPKEEDG